MITQEQMRALQEKWDINYEPSYREPECNDCGKKMRKCWHLWLRTKPTLFKRGWNKECHLCLSCGKKYGLKPGE